MPELHGVGLWDIHQVDDGLEGDDTGIVGDQIHRLSTAALLQQLLDQLLGTTADQGLEAGDGSDRETLRRQPSEHGVLRRVAAQNVPPAGARPEQGVILAFAFDPEGVVEDLPVALLGAVDGAVPEDLDAVVVSRHRPFADAVDEVHRRRIPQLPVMGEWILEHGGIRRVIGDRGLAHGGSLSVPLRHRRHGCGPGHVTDAEPATLATSYMGQPR